MNKELETQPYRLFKEYLDKIINMPDNIKNELVEIFEKKRLENQNVAEEQEINEEQEDEKKEENTLFNRFFSENQSLQQSEKPSLTSANAPQHKCKIRDW